MVNGRPLCSSCTDPAASAAVLGAYGGPGGVPGGPTGGRRSCGPRTPSPAPPPPAQWHIPQLALGGEPPAPRADPAAPPAPDYKITLGRARASSAVTSTNPETPSPSLNVRTAACSVETVARRRNL